MKKKNGELKEVISLTKGKVTFNAPMRGHTSFQIGGYADLLVDVTDKNDLKNVLLFAKEKAVDVFLMGEGTNLLVLDSGIRGIVIRLKGEFQEIEFYGNSVKAGAGVLVSNLVNECAGKGLSGLEFLAGIPGSAGGAVIMNAGAWGKCSWDFISKIEVLEKGSFGVKELKKNDLNIGYRMTDITKRDLIVLSAEFSLKNEKPAHCTAKIEEILKKRKEKHPLNFPNAGCIFKNPDGKHAGKIIEELGLKGKRMGNAEISRKHGNFIINLGNAKADDVLALINDIEKEAFSKKGIKFEREIVIIGDDEI